MYARSPARMIVPDKDCRRAAMRGIAADPHQPVSPITCTTACHGPQRTAHDGCTEPDGRLTGQMSGGQERPNTTRKYAPQRCSCWSIPPLVAVRFLSWFWVLGSRFLVLVLGTSFFVLRSSLVTHVVAAAIDDPRCRRLDEFPAVRRRLKHESQRPVGFDNRFRIRRARHRVIKRRAARPDDELTNAASGIPIVLVLGCKALIEMIVTVYDNLNAVVG